MTTAVATPDAPNTPFFHTLPLWVLDAGSQKGVKGREIVGATVTAKTASLRVVHADGTDELVKVFRRNAFPGRSASE